jgi:hypothetical protein
MGKKMVLTFRPADALEKAEMPKVERCFGRARDSLYNQLKILLRRFSTIKWHKMRTHDEEVLYIFYEAAWQFGLVSNQNQETEICLQNAIEFDWFQGGIGFPFAQIVH